ncbi:MAG: ABC transporter substrate-binding protein [Pseudomonadota bacterium]
MTKSVRIAIGATAVGLLWTAPASAQSLAISCGAVGMELQLCQEGAEAWSAESGIPVEVVSTPNSTSERLALYQQLLASGSGDIDVFQIDVIWPGILGPHFADLSDAFTEEEVAAHFEAIIENNTIDDELKAIPWFTDAGVLYYRTDLLEAHGHQPPSTWQEMATIAADIQEKERAAGNERMQGFVFQGNAYEGLTCNALEWIDAWGGGTLVDADGSVSVNNPNAVAAIDEAASWINTISPQGVLSYQEEEARGVFQSGHAVFMRNWPYAWALGNAPDSPVSGKIGVMALPPGGEEGHETGVLGGWSLAVSRYSDNPEAAMDLVRFLASYDEQKRRAVEGGYNPTIAALYEDADVLDANPFFGELYETFVNAVARPSGVTGTRYNQVSTEFWNAVHRVLSGEATAEDSLADLERRLQRLARNWR